MTAVGNNIEQLDAALLAILQQEIPLVDRPFAEIGRRLDLDELETLRRIRRMSAQPGAVIRQISAIFDSPSLGYKSCLVAAKVDEARLDEAAEIINRHPGVTHNYQRNHAYNLWFTLAVPPDSTLGLERTLEILSRQSGAAGCRMLPSLKLYKIGVKFDLTGENDASARSEPVARSRVNDTAGISAADRRMIRALQMNLPLVPEPFRALAVEAGEPTNQLLAAAQRYLRTGVMRRFAAVLRHRAAGFGANAMGVWIVPPGREDEFGAIAASFDAVSHCYRRPTYADWPYSVFTMVHGKDRAACEAVLAEISGLTGVKDYAALYSSREFKKTRLRYFTPEIADWERQATADSQI